MLASLADLGYVVEWRVVNAADYGMPQRRRRVFILAYQKGTQIWAMLNDASPEHWITSTGVLATAFPVEQVASDTVNSMRLHGDLVEITNGFNAAGRLSPFQDGGLLVSRDVWTSKTSPFPSKKTSLGSVLVPECEVPPDFYIDELEPWAMLKGAKSLERTSRATGHTYRYSEGAMRFPEPLDEPSRTIITGEGGRSPSRFKHVIEVNGRYRRLVPEELERLNMFEPGHTAGIPAGKRAFLMGNALVTGVVERTAVALAAALGTKLSAHERPTRGDDPGFQPARGR
jgi:DNA (cytosine-5)-methyltransferase 1